MEPFIELIDGTVVGTGLKIPTSLVTRFDAYADKQKMFTREELQRLAKPGRESFDPTWNKNQRNRGSCNGFAGATALAKSRKRRGLKRVDLSGAYLYSLINDNMDRGSMLEDGMEKLQTVGCCREEYANWNQIYRNSYNRERADADAQNFKAFDCYVLARGSDPELEIFSALANNFDIVVAVHATGSFMRLNGDGICGLGNGPGNHAVSCDGYKVNSQGKLMADMDNSWGTEVGENGRGYLTWDAHMRFTRTYHMFYAIRCTSDPKGEEGNPPVAKV